MLGISGLLSFSCTDGLRSVRRAQLASSDPATLPSLPGQGGVSSTTTTSTTPTTAPFVVSGTGCAPLPPSGGTVIQVTPAQATNLPTIVQNAPSGSVIVLADGVYPVSRSLAFGRNNVTLRSARSQAGQAMNPGAVIIDGMNSFNGANSDTRVDELVRIFASDITITDVTFRNARDHIVHVYPTATASVTGTKIHAVRILDPGEQAVKINNNPSVATYPDDGEITCSRIELSDAARAWVEGRFADGCYTGGIDGHHAKGWRFTDNVIKGFWCPTGLSEHAIHMWTGSRDTVSVNNILINNARGVGYGLAAYNPTNNLRRNYSDAPCGGRQNAGHYGGLVANNFILGNDPRLLNSSARFDVGVGLEDACDARVVHNTIVSTGYLFAGIDLRFVNTVGGIVANNLSTHRLVVRDSATNTSTGHVNVWNAPTTLFRSVADDGDLHLLPTASTAINRGAMIPGINDDIDGDPRDAMPDLGADELD